jgi:hypothetical protein
MGVAFYHNTPSSTPIFQAKTLSLLISKTLLEKLTAAM